MTLEEREIELALHLKKKHAYSPFATYLKEIVYGGVDGIITTFAVVAGFSGAALGTEETLQFSSMVVLLFGLANLFADGVSMGLGNFLSIRSDQSLYRNIRKKEEHETQRDGDIEAEETITILMEKGFDENDARTITALYRKNQKYWVDFMMVNELKMDDPRDDHPVYSGFATFTAFVFFGIIPLLPFVYAETFSEKSMFAVSTASTFLALVLLGFFKGKIVGSNILRSIFEVVLIGESAALVAFIIGTLFTL